MIYFGNPCSSDVRMLMSMRESPVGCIVTPAQGNRIPEGARYCADNGCFGKGYPGDDKWMAWLAGKAGPACEFATAPDVVGDARATLERSLPWLPKIRELGVRAALVAQDGLEELEVPWDEFDALFIGGSTEWKLSFAAKALSLEAKDRGKWVHMGRVSSLKRSRIAQTFGCDSVDGTFLRYGAAKNLPQVLAWMDAVNGTDWAEWFDAAFAVA